MRAYRGTLTEPGKDSPYRNRSVEENLQLFEEMKIGKFPDGHCVLRAKIDNTSPNMNMRDPTLYRIKHSVHPITGNKWCIYPMYDFAHALSDAIEGKVFLLMNKPIVAIYLFHCLFFNFCIHIGITHSLCTLEFADHRPLYDWTIDQIIPSGLLPFKNEKWRPTQIEFSRLNLQYTVLSKRKLIQLVTNNHVEGWNDPRMPTISGLRRRGYPANSIKLFCDRIGISRAENNIEMEVFEETIREYLDAEAPRIFAIINPLKLTITNWPTDMIESFNIENHPKRPDYGNREISFTNEIYIDKADFFDTGIDGKTPPPKGYKRLVPDGTVRLKYGYVIKCDKVIRDASTHEVLELQCSYDKDSASGSAPTAMKKPKGIIQWLSKQYARPIKMHEYDRLFLTPNPGKDQPDGDFIQDLNPNSKTVITTALIENSIMQWKYGSVFQFERVGYFYLDPVSNGKQMTDRVSDSQVNTLVFNRVVTLKDTWQQTMTDEDSSVSTSSSQQQKGSPPKASVDTKFANFYKLDLRVGEIVEVANHPDADSLYVSKINLGDESGPRTVVSGLVKYFQPSELLGKKVLVLCNLKPSKLRGILSEGMVLTAVIPSDDGSNNSKIELIQPTKESVAGESIILPAEYKAPAPPAAENAKSNLSKDVWTKIAVNLKINSNKMLSFDDATLTTTTGSPLVTTTFVDTIIQ